MAETKQNEFVIEGKPYFLFPCVGGSLAIARRVVEYSTRMAIEVNDDDSHLFVGKDLRELPSAFNLCFDVESHSNFLNVHQSFIEECRRFGKSVGVEYVGAEHTLRNDVVTFFEFERIKTGMERYSFVPRIFERIY